MFTGFLSLFFTKGFWGGRLGIQKATDVSNTQSKLQKMSKIPIVGPFISRLAGNRIDQTISSTNSTNTDEPKIFRFG